MFRMIKLIDFPNFGNDCCCNLSTNNGDVLREGKRSAFMRYHYHVQSGEEKPKTEEALTMAFLLFNYVHRQ